MLTIKNSTLLHPVYLVALLVLITNDHFLKIHSPGWVTGKLSDFAGLIVFSVLLSTFCRNRITTRYDILVVHLLVGLVFVVWKLLPVGAWIGALSPIGFPELPSVTHDATDLLALAILPVSYRLVVASVSEDSQGGWRWSWTSALRVCLLILSCAAVVATSPPWYRHQVSESMLVPSSVSQARILYLIESTLINEGFVVSERNVLSDSHFSFEFSYEGPNRSGVKLDSVPKGPRIYSAELSVLRGPDAWQIEVVDLLIDRKTAPGVAVPFIEQRILRPLRESLEVFK